MKLLKLAFVALTGVSGLSIQQDGHIETLMEVSATPQEEIAHAIVKSHEALSAFAPAPKNTADASHKSAAHAAAHAAKAAAHNAAHAAKKILAKTEIMTLKDAEAQLVDKVVEKYVPHEAADLHPKNLHKAIQTALHHGKPVSPELTALQKTEQELITKIAEKLEKHMHSNIHLSTHPEEIVDIVKEHKSAHAKIAEAIAKIMGTEKKPKPFSHGQLHIEIDTPGHKQAVPVAGHHDVAAFHEHLHTLMHSALKFQKSALAPMHPCYSKLPQPLLKTAAGLSASCSTLLAPHAGHHSAGHAAAVLKNLHDVITLNKKDPVHYETTEFAQRMLKEISRIRSEQAADDKKHHSVEEHLEHLLKAADFAAQLAKHKEQQERAQDAAKLKELLMELVKMKAAAVGGHIETHKTVHHTATGQHTSIVTKKINATTTEIITTTINATHGHPSCGVHDAGSPKHNLAKMHEALLHLKEEQHRLQQKLWIKANIHIPTPEPVVTKTAKPTAKPDEKPKCFEQCNKDTTACFGAAKTDAAKDACGAQTAACAASCAHESLVAAPTPVVGCGHFKVPPKAPHPCAVPEETITTKFVTHLPEHAGITHPVEAKPTVAHKATPAVPKPFAGKKH